MVITKFEKTIIPRTLEGENFAYEYEKNLRERGIFRSRTENTLSIVLEARYYFTTDKEGEDDDN